MQIDYQKINTVVFDLDGTLYEDRQHFDYYAQRVKLKLPESIQGLFAGEYQKVIHNTHPLQPGRIYDILEDKLIVQVQNQIKEVYHWNGASVDPEEVKILYPHPVPIDLKRYFSIGDYWGVPVTIARHFGFQRKDINPAFMETRYYMMSDKFVMNPVEGFQDALLKLRENKNLVLLTNSPQPDSDVILSKLGLDQVFHKKVFNGKKPSQTKQRFTEIKEEFSTNFEAMLSVGDNYVNEIIHAKDLGLATLYIDSHHTGLSQGTDIVVSKIKEVIPYLHKLAE